jgi:hypothetical protein
LGFIELNKLRYIYEGRNINEWKSPSFN